MASVSFHDLRLEPADSTPSLSLATRDEYDRIVQNEKVKNKSLDIQRYIDVKKPHFINDLVMYYGKKKSNITMDTESIQEHVEQFTEDVFDNVCRVSALKGHLVMCGSMDEGTKIKTPNAFDFVFEASVNDMFCVPPHDKSTHDILMIEQSMPETFKNRPERSSIYERSFFKISIRGDIPEWCQPLMKCQSCKSCKQCVEEHEGRYVSSRGLLDYFVTNIRKVTSEMMNGSGLIKRDPDEKQIHEEAFVGNTGPAANIFTRFTDANNKSINIKIDLTLAIPIPNDEYSTWPLANYTDLELQSYIDTQISMCYLIPAGDYWKVSFLQDESRVMKEALTDKNKKYSYQAIKFMKEELSITDNNDESCILKIYPIKIAFLKETLRHREDWTMKTLGSHVVNILGNVEQERGPDGVSTSHPLTSYYLKNDPVLPGNSDKTLLEVRRIIKKLDDNTKEYMKHGRILGTMLIIYVICNVLILINMVIFIVQPVRIIPTNITVYIFVLLCTWIVTPVSLFVCIFGLIWTRTNSVSVVYKIYHGVTRTYCILIICNSTVLVLSTTQYMLSGPQKLCKPGQSIVDCWKFYLISMCIVCLVLFIILVHCVFVLVRGPDSCTRYTYPPEYSPCRTTLCCCHVIFMSSLYKETCRKPIA